MKYYFRCNTNPSAPLLVLDTEWEAKEMRTNVDYDAVDETGEPIIPTFDSDGTEEVWS